MTIKKEGKADQILNKLEEHDRKFEEFGGKFDEILSGQDKIMKKLETAREDRVFAKAADDKQNKRLDDLESRMQKVEAHAG